MAAQQMGMGYAQPPPMAGMLPQMGGQYPYMGGPQQYGGMPFPPAYGMGMQGYGYGGFNPYDPAYRAYYDGFEGRGRDHYRHRHGE